MGKKIEKLPTIELVRIFDHATQTYMWAFANREQVELVFEKIGLLIDAFNSTKEEGKR